MALKVLVAGATGRTGSLVMKKLKARADLFEARGFARSSEKVVQIFGDKANFYFGDIRQPRTLAPALEGCESLVILTSAAPQVQGVPDPSQRPELAYPEGEMPEAIDYQGQVNLIDAAKAAGVTHIVLVGSMGGTMPDHPLNKMGNGNILIWKRKAEDYLMASGLDYTLIHPGGLLDESGGRRELLLGQNDTFLSDTPGGIPASVPRADVAEVVVQALLEPAARGLNFDLISQPEAPDTETVTLDLGELLASL